MKTRNTAFGVLLAAPATTVSGLWPRQGSVPRRSLRIAFSAMLFVMAVAVIGNDATGGIPPAQEDFGPAFDRTMLKQHRLHQSHATYDCTSIEDSDEMTKLTKLFGGGAKSFKLEYDLNANSEVDGQWLLKSKLSYEGEQSITYYVVLSSNADVVSEKTRVKDVKKTMAKQNTRTPAGTRKKKEEVVTSQEEMTVREEEMECFGQSMGVSKVIRFLKDGQTHGTELAIPKDDIVLTFFQIPVFAGTIKNAPNDGVPFRCVHQGQPFPAVLKFESDDSTDTIYAVYKSTHAMSLEPADDAKPIFRLFFSKTDKFSLPDKIIVDLNGTQFILNRN